MSTGMGEVSSLLRKPEKHQQKGATKEKNTSRLERELEEAYYERWTHPRPHIPL